MEKTVNIGNKSYTLRTYGIPEWRAVMKAGVNGKDIDFTEYSLYSVFHSLKEWNLKDEKGEPIKLDWDNYIKYMSPAHIKTLTPIAEEVNDLTEEEKNALSGLSVKV